jgi:hypothetical protein
MIAEDSLRMLYCADFVHFHRTNLDFQNKRLAKSIDITSAALADVSIASIFTLFLTKIFTLVTNSFTCAPR